MAFTSAAVSVATTATAIHTFTSENTSVVLYNNGPATIFLGGSDVTTSTGLPLGAGASLATTGQVGEILGGVVSTGTVEVRVLRQGGA